MNLLSDFPNWNRKTNISIIGQLVDFIRFCTSAQWADRGVEEKLKRHAKLAGNLGRKLYPQPFTPPALALTGIQTTFVASLPLMNSNLDKCVHVLCFCFKRVSIIPLVLWYYCYNIQTHSHLESISGPEYILSLVKKTTNSSSLRHFLHLFL